MKASLLLVSTAILSFTGCLITIDYTPPGDEMDSSLPENETGNEATDENPDSDSDIERDSGCAYQWTGEKCDVCPEHWDPQQNCSKCVDGWDEAAGCELCIPGRRGENCDIYVVFVDVHAAAEPNGLTWETAFADIQSGIDRANDIIDSGATSSCEVWVGNGRYFVYQTAAWNSIVLSANVKLLGSFKGSEITPEERQFGNSFGETESSSIISARAGESGDDFELVVYTMMDVPVMPDTAAPERMMDGFVFENGESTYAAAMSITSDHFYLSRCLFRNNQAEDDARNSREGIVEISGASDVHIENCVFLGNSVRWGIDGMGGTIFIDESDAIVNNCSFGNEFGTSIGLWLSDHSSIHKNIVAGSIEDFSGWPFPSVTENLIPIYDPITFGYSNFEDDPRFVDPQSDLRLMSDSPCIDPESTSGATHDMDGIKRDEHPDLGAYEYIP